MKEYVLKVIKENPGITDIALAGLVKINRKDLNILCESLPVVRSVVSSPSGLLVLYYENARIREQVHPSRSADVPKPKAYSNIKPYEPKEISAIEHGGYMKITPGTIKADIEKFVSQEHDTVALFDFLSDLMIDIGTIISAQEAKRQGGEDDTSSEEKEPPKTAKKVVEKQKAEKAVFEAELKVKTQAEKNMQTALAKMIERVNAKEISQVKAAAELGLTRTTFRRKMELYNAKKT